MPVDGYLNFNTKIDTGGFEAGTKAVESSAKRAESVFSKLGKTIAAAFSVAAITAFGKKVVEAAAEVKAAGAQFEQTFGDMQDAAEAAISRVAEPADILADRLRGSATKIYAFAKTTGMESTQALTLMEDALQVAADSAAYYDRSIEDVTETLQSFLKGNYENDAALGLSATETTRNAKANQLYGKSFKDLSEAQKQITLLEMVKEANELSGAMGQAAREAEGWENVTGNLSEAWRQLIGVIGQPMLKLVTPIIQQITAALQTMTTVAKQAYNALAKVFGWEEDQAAPVQATASAQKEVTAAVEETEAAQEGALASFDDIEILASNTADAQETTATASAETALATTPEAEERTADTTWIDAFTEKLQGLKDFIDNSLKPTLSSIGDDLKQSFSDMGEKIEQKLLPVLNKVKEELKSGFSNIGNTITEDIAPTAQLLANGFTSALSEIGPVILSSLGNTASQLWEMFQTAFANIGNWINTKLRPALIDISENYHVSLADFIPDNLGELLAPIRDFFENSLPNMASMMGDTFLSMLDPIADWFTTSLPKFISQGIETGATVIGTLLSIFETVFSDVWSLVVDPFFTSFASDLLPTFTELGTKLLEVMTTTINAIKEIFDQLWENTVKRVLGLIGQAWSDMCSIISEKWERYGAPIFKKVELAIEATKEAWNEFYYGSIQPLLQKIMDSATELWEDHLKGFFEKVVDFIARVSADALDLYNTVIVPAAQWINDYVVKPMSHALGVVIDIFSAILGNLIDFVGDFLDWLGSVIDFITDVFKGDWGAAWEDIKAIADAAWNMMIDALKASVNVIIGLLNAMISAVFDAINWCIDKINSMIETANSALKKMGLPTIKISIKNLDTPQIPYLASGAVIPPNREFLAVLGDQKSGINIETPLETMLDAFRQALAENGGANGKQTVILQLDKRELGRAVIETGNEETRRIGLKLVKA